MVYYQEAEYTKLVQDARGLYESGLVPLLGDDSRNEALLVEDKQTKVVYDMSRQFIDMATIQALEKYCEHRKVTEKMNKMFTGEIMNETEKRPVLHVALRAKEAIMVDGHNVVQDVTKTRDRMTKLANSIRDGGLKGTTGKLLRTIIYVGIGGSYLGPEAIYESLRFDPTCHKKAKGFTLKFLANVDPMDFAKAIDGVDPAETLVIIASKTFTTAETLRNARLCKDWLEDNKLAVKDHLCACSTNLTKTSEFGINSDNVFPFWDWVGGRYSVTSAIGILPLSIVFGPESMDAFLDGCNAGDMHFKNKPFRENIPYLMGALSFYNSSVCDCHNVAVLPYSQALSRFAAHIQQLTMESNGKRVNVQGESLEKGHTGEIFFGEPGTNGQHSFYQLLHQGLVPCNCEFIGFAENQAPAAPRGAYTPGHDELMANLFAQPDALAYGKDRKALLAQGTPEALIPHKTFTGNKQSTIMIMPKCSPFYVGLLLAFYEHRTAVHGWLLGVNSFDQFGVELGKELALTAGKAIEQLRIDPASSPSVPKHTLKLIQRYINIPKA